MHIPVFPHVLICALFTATKGLQTPLTKEDGTPAGKEVSSKKIAIIGGGIAGASAAYRLRTNYGYLAQLEITVYEASDHLGGRVNSTLLRNAGAGHYTGFTETGATDFSANDICIQEAIDETGLRSKVVERWNKLTRAAIWDGESLFLEKQLDLNPRSWKDAAHYAWKYGQSPQQVKNLATTAVTKLRNLFNQQSSPWDLNLQESVSTVGLEPQITQSAHKYLASQNLADDYTDEVISATTRARHLHDLETINGISALTAMDTDPTYFINSHSRGNAELVYRLMQLSEARIMLNAPVADIGRGPAGKYTIRLADAAIDMQKESKGSEGRAEYDAILIATPLAHSGIEFDFPAVEFASSAVKYVARHVTSFTTTDGRFLSPAYFNTSGTGALLPDRIFTIPTKGQSSPPFFLIERREVERGLDGDVIDSDNLYTVTSENRIVDDLLAALLGTPKASSPSESGIGWLHRVEWPHAVPATTPGPLLDSLILDKGLYYAGAGDELIASMEMACKIGARTADRLFMEWWREPWSDVVM